VSLADNALAETVFSEVRFEAVIPRRTMYEASGIPLGAAAQVRATLLGLGAVAATFVGAEGSASVVADTVADSGETSPPVSVAWIA
jgi:hypothetical protein